jgi:tRNA 2-thiouridine synthesizing protein A
MSDIAEISPDETLDTNGLSCPMPLLKTKRALTVMETGKILEVLGTDPGSINDIPNWCKRSGNSFLYLMEDAGHFKIYIQKN